MESAVIAEQVTIKMVRPSGSLRVGLTFGGQPRATFESGRFTVRGMSHFADGDYRIDTDTHELERHILEFREPKSVKSHSRLISESIGATVFQILHPCFPAGEAHRIDSSVPLLRKGIVEGEVGFLTEGGEAVLKCEHSATAERWTEINLVAKTGESVLLEGACLMASALVLFHPLQDYSTPYEY